MTPSRIFVTCVLAALMVAGSGAKSPARAQTDSTGHLSPPVTAPAPAPAATAPAQAPAMTPQPAPAGTMPAQVAAPSAGTQVATPEPSDRDGGWPRLVETPSGAVLIMYQPQVVSWERQRDLVAMGALSYQAKGKRKPDMGTLTFTAQTSVSTEERMVKMENLKITEMKFSTLEANQSREALAEIQKTVPAAAVFIGLDRMLAMVDKSTIRGSSVQVKTDPPPIFYSTKPAILLQFDGAPIWATMEKGSIKYVLNTNWDVLQDPQDEDKKFYLRNDATWLEAENIKGPWKGTKKLPKSFNDIPANDSWNDVKSNIPPKKKKDVLVLYSERPAELLLLDGNPKLEKIEGTKVGDKKNSELQWVKNTEADLFYIKEPSETYYYLVSGYWFSTNDLEKGPWKFATQELPDQFSLIPTNHERARVRSSVPGTDEAAEAVLLAQVPQTATVDRGLKPASVVYDGEPKFQAIEGAAGVQTAVNTQSDVFIVGGKYYLCQAGVWFSSNGANGPWQIETKIPPEIYKIPPSSSSYNVTYVTVVDDDANNPTYGYTPGYMGVTIAFGCAMWGAGYYYPPYYGSIYYPRPVYYGGGAMYNPRTGAYGHYQSAYGPYGGVTRAATYNPSTGTYARGAKAYGPGGSRGYAEAYNPRTNTYASTRQGSSPYGSWGSSQVKRGDDWVRTQRVTDSNGNSKWQAQGSGGGSATGGSGQRGSGFVGQSGSGDVYAGKDGNVYKKTDGGWQSYDNGSWNDVNRPSGGGDRPGAGGGGTNRPSTGQLPAGGAGAGGANRPSTGGPSASQQPANRPSAGTQPSASTRPSSGSSTMGQLDRDAASRSQGQQRTNSNYGGSSSSSRSASRGSSGSSGGGRRGGGGGGRRR